MAEKSSDFDGQKDRLFELCFKFIQEQEISCSEAVYQSDRVIENAYELIDGICKIVGYYE
jgi:hypothetical protein